MKTQGTIAALLFLSIASGCQNQQGAASSAASPVNEKSPVFISVVSDMDSNPQAVDMALKVAGFSLDEQRSVFLFFNVKGVHVPAASLADDAAFQQHAPVKSQLSDLIKRGVRVHVCPICMKASSIEAGDLMTGAQVTTRAELFEAIRSDTSVFTY
jgi:predicted peroxiredoxin